MLIVCLLLISTVAGDNSVTPADGRLGAAQKLEQQFSFLLATISRKIDPAVEFVSNDLSQSKSITLTYGSSIMIGALADILGNYYVNDRAPLAFFTDPDFVYSSGYFIGYGVGFGGPYLLPTYLPSPNLDCSANDFNKVVSKYGIGGGVRGFTRDSQVYAFTSDSKQALFCLLQHSGDYSEAAEVGYLLDDLQEAALLYRQLN